jgi:hypothetical protein
MPFTIQRSNQAPVILVSLDGQIHAADIQACFQESYPLITPDDKFIAYIWDFDRVLSLGAKDVVGMVEVFGKHLGIIRQQRTLLCVFIHGRHEAVIVMSQMLTEAGYETSHFFDADDIITYINLKIKAFHLKQTLASKGTQDLHSTIVMEEPLVGLSLEELRNLSRKVGTGEFFEHSTLRLESTKGDNSLSVLIDREIIIGRRVEGGEKPGIDLSLWGGFQEGVSRQHAKIFRTADHRLALIDLGSTNGTYLNHQQLIPFHEYLLHDGDELIFGRLAVRIYFKPTDRLN